MNCENVQYSVSLIIMRLTHTTNEQVEDQNRATIVFKVASNCLELSTFFFTSII